MHQFAWGGVWVGCLSVTCASPSAARTAHDSSAPTPYSCSTEFLVWYEAGGGLKLPELTDTLLNIALTHPSMACATAGSIFFDLECFKA